MCLPDSQIVLEPDDSEAGVTVSRRTALVGGGCVALAAVIPGGAHAARSARTRARLGTLPLQSPIDLREDDITFVDRLPRVRFGYPETVDVTLEQVGEGEFRLVRAAVRAGVAHITVSGMRWNLDNFHWHTPSEHEIEGEKTPLEMHLVHFPAETEEDPEQRPAVALVLAVFIEQGRNNPALEPIFEDLPEGNRKRRVRDVRLTELLPDERESFRFRGSLTTPPFTEPVLWVVFAESIETSSRHIGAYQALFPDGNSREVQPLNGREVLSDAKDFFD
jgi:carbonic anhydrase